MNVTSVAPPSYIHTNRIATRLEWNPNFGYCGEASFVSAGLFYGQYCSQYTARALASPGVHQYENGSQLFVGINDQTAAKAMHLNTIEWDTDDESDTNDFLVWVKQCVLQGYPVIFGIFNNEYLLYGITDPNAGDKEYDHIVVANGISSNYPLSDMGFFPDDTLYFSDNGLWDENPPFIFTYPFGSFEANRAQANALSGPIYSLNNDASNFGIAVTGVTDPGGYTIPVRLDTNVNDEIPEILEGSDTPPIPFTLTLTVTVTIPDQTKSYNLYRYNDFSKVPNTHFNANAANAYQTFLIPSGELASYILTMDIQSNEIAAFRAVATTAP